MSNEIRVPFMALIALQGLHSVEEFIFRLWEVFPPMALLYRDSPELARPAFVAFNALLFAAGLFCLWRWVWPGVGPARAAVWIWVAGEGFNAAAHAGWAMVTQRYNPGLATGLLIAPVVAYLAWRLGRTATRA